MIKRVYWQLDWNILSRSDVEWIPRSDRVSRGSHSQGDRIEHRIAAPSRDWQRDVAKTRACYRCKGLFENVRRKLQDETVTGVGSSNFSTSHWKRNASFSFARYSPQSLLSLSVSSFCYHFTNLNSISILMPSSVTFVRPHSFAAGSPRESFREIFFFEAIASYTISFFLHDNVISEGLQLCRKNCISINHRKRINRFRTFMRFEYKRRRYSSQPLGIYKSGDATRRFDRVDRSWSMFDAIPTGWPVATKLYRRKLASENHDMTTPAFQLSAYTGSRLTYL